MFDLRVPEDIKPSSPGNTVFRKTNFEPTFKNSHHLPQSQRSGVSASDRSEGVLVKGSSLRVGIPAGGCPRGGTDVLMSSTLWKEDDVIATETSRVHVGLQSEQKS